MNTNNFPLDQLAHQTIEDRVASASAARAPRDSTIRVPEQGPRRALARGLRRVANALDN